jgi:hypothetical protein
VRFKEWLELQEIGTSTSCIAGFSRIVMPLVTRQWPSQVTMMFQQDPPPKKEKTKKKKRVEECSFFEGREIGHSWLDPNGNFNHLSGGKSHGDFARMTGKTIDKMWSEGWLRVVYINNMLYAHNESMVPNPRQIAALKDAAIENNFTHVIYDSGDSERVIWSEYDKI